MTFYFPHLYLWYSLLQKCLKCVSLSHKGLPDMWENSLFEYNCKVCFCQQKGFKGDTSVTFIRAEFNQVVLGDSAKITVSPEGTAKYNFTCSFEFNPEGGGIALDDLAHKPVFCKSL